MRVTVEDTLSPITNVGAGVPQGGVLSPLLYVLYTHDVPRPPLTALYADDTAHIISKPTPQEASETASSTLQATADWAQRTRTKINETKTQLLYINPAGGRRPNLSVKLNGQTLQPTSQLTYLGVSFDQNLSFNNHVKKTTGRAKQIFFALKRYITCHPESQPTWEKLYPTTIQPIMAYGMEALSTIGQEALRQLEVAERSMLRQVYRADRREGNEALYNGKIQPIAKVIRQRAKETLTAAAQSTNPLINTLGQYEELGYTFRRPGDLTTSSSSDESNN